MSNQQNDDLHEICFEALCVGYHVWDETQFSAMCHVAGIPSREVLKAAEEDMEPSKRRHFMEDAIDFADSLKER